MPILSNEQITSRTMTPTADGRWTASRTWLVSGAKNETEARGAQPLPGTPPIDQIGNSHPECPILLVRSHNFACDEGAFTWTITANYEIPVGEASSINNDTSLLTRLPVVSWGMGTYSLNTDVTIKKNPVVNACGDPFDPPLSRSIPEYHFRISQWEASFDIQNARRFALHVNDANLQLGPIKVLRGELFCASIFPIEEYAIGAKSVHVAYDFVMRIDNRVDGDSSYPFQTHLVNKGRRGFWLDTSTTRFGEFYQSDGSGGYERVSSDVLIDLNGIPLDSTIKVTSAGKTPVANPKAIGLNLKPSPLSVTGKQVVLQFDEIAEADFSQMGL